MELAAQTAKHWNTSKKFVVGPLQTPELVESSGDGPDTKAGIYWSTPD